MYKLIKLELRRNSIKPYNISVLIITAVMIGMLYLLAVIPKLDPEEADMDLFMNYGSLANLMGILCMVTFVILSSVMYARFVVEEYSGKRAILLFSYPVDRGLLLKAKVIVVCIYTILAMIFSGGITFGVFFITESLFPICTDQLKLKTIVDAALTLISYSIMAGVWSIIPLWLGFWKQSTSVTIVSAVIMVTSICQIMTTFMNYVVAVLFLFVGFIAALVLLKSLTVKMNTMEV